VRTGENFGELDKQLELLYGRTLIDRPQFDGLGVGGAVRTCGHGWHTKGFLIDSVLALRAVKKGTMKQLT